MIVGVDFGAPQRERDQRRKIIAVAAHPTGWRSYRVDARGMNSRLLASWPLRLAGLYGWLAPEPSGGAAGSLRRDVDQLFGPKEADRILGDALIKARLGPLGLDPELVAGL